MARAFIARMRWAAHKWREFDPHAAAAFSLRLVETIAELERVVVIDEAVG